MTVERFAIPEYATPEELVSSQISNYNAWRFVQEAPMLAAISGCGEVQQPCPGIDTPLS